MSALLLHVTTSSDQLYGFAVCPLESPVVAIGCAYALSAAFRLITHLHLANSEHCTFQVVHYCPGVVRQVCDVATSGADESLLIARSLYTSHAPSVWLCWMVEGNGKRRPIFRSLHTAQCALICVGLPSLSLLPIPMIVSRDLTFVLSHVGSSFVLLLWADPIPASGLF